MITSNSEYRLREPVLNLSFRQNKTETKASMATKASTGNQSISNTAPTTA